ncbi:hypothetical protein Droror1_Dr00028024 [Drosera rotundifolia]
MELSRSQSIFQDITSRELSGLRGRKRLRFGAHGAEATSKSFAVAHCGEETPPLAVSFCKTSKSAYILAAADEDGYLSLFDTRFKSSSLATCRENSDKAGIASWVVHQNAVFDISWIKDDAKILTASADQTIKVWDVQERKCTRTLTGHTGTIKSLSSHPTNSDLAISGSRDGSFALWDLRCQSTNIRPSAVVNRAHVSANGKRIRQGKAASMSITSVLYLMDEVSVATAGAVDSILKFWDTRNLKTQVTQTCPHSGSEAKAKGRLHGITSLSQDQNGVFLSASCRDNRIYLYNLLQLDKGPISSFLGCQIESFFVKSSISPDASYMLSGSTDGNTYIWQMNRPEAAIALTRHDDEVTAVDWNLHELGKIATASDDFTVCVWNMESRFYPSTRIPSSTRRRVMAMPSVERKWLAPEIQKTEPEEQPCTSPEAVRRIPGVPKMPEVCTPESHKNISTGVHLIDFEITPEAGSPSSVLCPPSSIKKKTIRDYFVAIS